MGEPAEELSGPDRWRVDPPEGTPTAEPCSRHPGAKSVFVAIPVLLIAEGDRAATVQGYACRGCWTVRGFVIRELDPLEDVSMDGEEMMPLEGDVTTGDWP